MVYLTEKRFTRKANEMEHLYSVVPLLEDHFEERVLDIVEQYERKVTTCPLFIVNLEPEGIPVWNKAEGQAQLYGRYCRSLAEHGIPSGVLILVSIGADDPGYAPTTFKRVIGFADGKEHLVYCPMDEDVVAHLASAIKRVAMEHPKVIMLDDDVRLLVNSFYGCACPMHMAEFNRRNNTDMTREDLVDYVKTHAPDDPLNLSFQQTQIDSLRNYILKVREAIDSVDPTIQGINCTSGDMCDCVVHYAKDFAGKGNPTIVRTSNGTYAPASAKEFSDTMRRAKVRGSRLKKHGVDIVLAETDTVPHNRYAKNSRYLHSHFAASILDGLDGAKHWLTRTRGYEMNSGKKYRDILEKHVGYYDELVRISKKIKFVGAAAAYIEQEYQYFFGEKHVKRHDNFWTANFFERVGIPFYFSDEAEKAVFLEGKIVSDMTDEHIKELFCGSVFCSSDAASDLALRGYGHLLGVDVKENREEIINGEVFDEEFTLTANTQIGVKELIPTSEKTEKLSYCYKKTPTGFMRLFPAVTLFEREGGKVSGVFAGVPKAPYHYTTAFSFLTETRKNQLIGMLKRAGALPVYLYGDNEICMRAGYLDSGELFTMLFNLGYDPEEKVVYYLEKAPKKAEKLEADGSYSEIKFTSLGNNLYEFDAAAEPMYPLAIKIAQ